ncbi:hypothetical protein OG342_04700 [Streptomyces bobili]|uniref:hypothetical protein n=1 Tax=Streptomyces bobili TaxID=67280 RepID=UPI002257A1E5|nr:hypothetical protein [Streptomyces bobili]MCX5522167.1 hypothetical protein [Streptomyces bobili]
MATFTDDFNRADSSDLGANWVEVSGEWSIVSNRLSPGAAGGTIILRAAGAMASNDNYAQVTFAATAAASHGVWCRGNANISSGYLWRNDGSSWNLFSVVGGSFSSIGSFAGAAIAGDVAKVQAVGSTITAYVNGVQRVSVVDTNVLTGTSVGIRSESVGALRFDDFAAGDVTAGATLGVASAVEAAQLLAGTKTATPGHAAATDAAQPFAGAKSAALATATGVESAQAVSGSKAAVLGVNDAVESAQSLAGVTTAGLTPAVGQDAAQALSGVKAGALGTAGTVESAQPLTGTKAASLAPAGEEETAQALADVTPAVLGVAETVEIALPLVGAKAAGLLPALEVDAARPLPVPSDTAPSPERTFRIPGERRQLAVAAERRLVVVAEHRTLIVR